MMIPPLSKRTQWMLCHLSPGNVQRVKHLAADCGCSRKQVALMITEAQVAGLPLRMEGSITNNDSVMLLSEGRAQVNAIGEKYWAENRPF